MHRFLGKSLLVAVLGSSFLLACSSGREVEVTGEVSAGSSVSVEGPILLELYDVEDVDGEQELNLVHSAELSSLGEFAEKADFEGQSIVIRAINDQNGDGVCSPGEAWGEATVTIGEDDTAPAAAILLTTASCPVAAE